MRVALLLALLAAAAAQYTQSQAQSFLQVKGDVLAAVAPSIYPINKLAARVSLTFATPKDKPISDAYDAIKSAMADMVQYSIISTELVVYFQAYSYSADNLLSLVATWAEVPESNVLVVLHDGPGGVPDSVKTGGKLYNVTVLPGTDSHNFNNPYKPVVDVVALLLANLPANDPNFECSNCGSRCSCANICYIQKQPAFFQYAYTPSGTNCKSSFVGGVAALRYTVDLFSNYDVANSVAATDLTRRWTATVNSYAAMPATTLQYTYPVVQADPGPLNLTISAYVSSGVSVALLAVMGVFWYRRSSGV